MTQITVKSVVTTAANLDKLQGMFKSKQYDRVHDIEHGESRSRENEFGMDVSYEDLLLI